MKRPAFDPWVTEGNLRPPSLRRAGAQSESAWLPDGAGFRERGRALQRHAPGPRGCLGDVGGGFVRQDNGQAPRHRAESRMITSERYLLRGSQPAHDLGAAFISGLFATCTQRASADCDCPRGSGDHGRIELGSGHGRNTTASSWWVGRLNIRPSLAPSTDHDPPSHPPKASRQVMRAGLRHWPARA